MNRSIYFPSDLEKKIVRDAKKRKVSVSKLVVEMIERLYSLDK